jgi:cobalt-zinc-cadmium efflux system protein
MPHEHDHSGHAHSSGHAGHSHGVSPDADAAKLSIALGLILGFMVIEVVVGILAHSLALLSDAGTCSPTPPRSASR